MCMKKLLIALLFTGIVSPAVVFAGGIVTNANQSASYVRMLARDASTSLDAVYYNPAGITKLADGFHLSINNQSLFQKKTIENKFVYLNDGKYVGDVSVPLYPDIYAVYKKNKLALGFGFTPSAGGGSAKYNTGLPSFEIPVAAIPKSLTLNNIPTTNYAADINFEGSSVFWGVQANASYAVNDMISLSAGVRMVLAKNTYKGYLRNIMIDPNYPAFNTGGRTYVGGMVSATQFFADGNTYLTSMVTNATNAANGLNAAISGGTPSGTPLSALPTGASIAALLAGAGVNTTGMTIGAASTALTTVAVPTYTAKANAMAANSAATADKDVDAEQTGTGYTPILGANLTFGEKLNIGIKYEFKTKLTLKNNTKIDGTGMFTDKAEIRSDVPAILSIGIGYKVLTQLRISAGLHYYFDKDATIEKAPGVKKDIEGNLYEIALGGEYDITDKILISAGYLYAKTGVGQGYQTDLSHSLTSSTVGFGGGFKITEKMQLNLGMLYTMYNSDSKSLTYTLNTGQPTEEVNTYNETYNRTNLGFSIGVDYHF